jgi:hypothetical protein
VKKQKMQHAVDDAALSAAQVIIDNQQNGIRIAKEIGGENGLIPNDIGVLNDTSQNTVTVNYSHDAPTFFLSIFNFKSVKLSVSATAQYTQQSKVIPLAFKKGSFDPNPPGDPNNNGLPAAYRINITVNKTSDYGLIDLSGLPNSKSALDRCISSYNTLTYRDGNTLSGSDPMDAKFTACGFLGKIGLNTSVPTGGNKIESIRSPIQTRINQSNSDPVYSGHCSDNGGFPGRMDCPRVVLVPIVEDFANSTVTIIGFAKFWLRDINEQISSKELLGYFMGNETGAGDYKPFRVRLIK